MNYEQLIRVCLGINIVMVYGNIVVYFKTNQPGLMQGALIPRVIVTIGAIGIMIGLTVIAITLLELIQQKGQQKKS